MKKSKSKHSNKNNAKSSVKTATKKSAKKFASTPKGKFTVSLLSAIISTGIIGLFLMYGPITYFRELLITSAMTTINHKYLATWFYPQKTIDYVMSKNTVIEPDANTNDQQINIANNNKNEMKLTEISKDGYKGWVLEISDPSKVILGVSKYFGTKGQKMPYFISNYDALAGINAGGFGDSGGHGNGGVAMGLVISEGKVLKMPQKSSYDVIGFDYNDVLIIGKYTASELEQLNLRDAVEFNPRLIVNGEPATIKGNGGWGMAPRTAIGQRKDGTVLFVVIDGRSLSSTGVTMKTLQEIMIDLDAYNAANLDGGSSTVLYYDNDVVNNPSGSDADGMRFLPNAFLVMK